jgi:hypothetical protein
MNPRLLEDLRKHGKQIRSALGERRPATGLGQGGGQRARGRASQYGLEGIPDRDPIRFHLRQTGEGRQPEKRQTLEDPAEIFIHTSSMPNWERHGLSFDGTESANRIVSLGQGP